MSEPYEDKDRDADGKFAPKSESVTKSNKGKPHRFQKGQKRPKNAGRRKGTPNKATKAWKDCVMALSQDVELQEALRDRVLARPDLLLKVAEHAVGKPKETVEFTGELRMFVWPGDKDIAEEDEEEPGDRGLDQL